MKYVSPRSLKEGDLILDVRTTDEHNQFRLVWPHFHVELSSLKPREFIKEHGLDGSKTLYILCHSGHRSAQAAAEFIEQGFDNVAVIDGGLINAFNEGVPVMRD